MCIDESDFVSIAERNGLVFLQYDSSNRRSCFPLEINDDEVFENTESFTIDLVFSSYFLVPSRVILSPNVTTFQILDNDRK